MRGEAAVPFSAIGYITPRDKLLGRETEIWAERDRKREEASVSSFQGFVRELVADTDVEHGVPGRA